MQTIVTLTGPTASGKSTLLRELVAAGLQEIVSFTTRPPRPGEQDGRDYFFRSRDWVDEMLDDGELVEVNEFAGHIYGITRDSLERALDSGVPAVKVVDPNGLLTLRRVLPDSARPLAVYLDAPQALVMGRLADRYRTDPKMTLEDYARRANTYHAEESGWLDKHRMLFDIVAPALTDATRHSVLERVLGHCPSGTPQSARHPNWAPAPAMA